MQKEAYKRYEPIVIIIYVDNIRYGTWNIIHICKSY